MPAHQISQVFYCVLLVPPIVTALLLLLKNPLLRVIGTSGATFKPADKYFTIITVFTIPSVVSVSLGGQTRSEGAANKAMISMLTGIILNIILDLIFILAFGWGVAGAAWATVTGYDAGMVYGIVYFRSKDRMLSIRRQDFKPNKTMYAEIWYFCLSLFFGAGQLSRRLSTMPKRLRWRTRSSTPLCGGFRLWAFRRPL